MEKQTNFHILQTMISLIYISSKKIIVLEPGIRVQPYGVHKTVLEEKTLLQTYANPNTSKRT